MEFTKQEEKKGREILDHIDLMFKDLDIYTKNNEKPETEFK